MPPMNPAPTNPATAPAVKPGASPGPVGDREGDIAGQCRHQEPEREPAEGEQHRTQVLRQTAGGQVGQRVGGGDDVRQRIRLCRQGCSRCRSRRAGSPARSAGRPRRRTGSCSSRRSAGSAGSGYPSPRPPAAPSPHAGRGVAEPSTRAAFGLSAAATASAIIVSGSLMARLTPEAITGLPAKRWRSLTPTSVAKMTASAPAIVRGGQRRAARGSLGLDRQLHPGPFRGQLQCVGGHVGVRDPGRAGGDRDRSTCPAAQWLPPSGRPGPPGRGVRTTPVDQRDDIGSGGRRAQRRHEFRTDQRPGQAGQQLHVLGPGALRGGDEEHQIGRAVGRAEVDRRVQPGEPDRGLAHGRRPAVRDRDPAGQPGRRLRLAGHARPRSAPARRRPGPPAASRPASRPITASLSAPASASSSTRSVLMIDGFVIDHLRAGSVNAVTATSSRLISPGSAASNPAGPPRRCRRPPPSAARGARALDVGADVAGQRGVAGADGAARLIGGGVASQAPSASTSTAPAAPRVASTDAHPALDQQAAPRRTTGPGVAAGHRAFQRLRRHPGQAGEFLGVGFDQIRGRAVKSRGQRGQRRVGGVHRDLAAVRPQRRHHVRVPDCLAGPGGSDPDSTTHRAARAALDHRGRPAPRRRRASMTARAH